MYFDTHAHLADDSLWGYVDDYITIAFENSVTHINTIAIDCVSTDRLVELSKRHQNIFVSSGIPPTSIMNEHVEMIKRIELAVENNELIAIGETGLDLYYTSENIQLQKELFIKHLNIALDANLPVIIHCRDAFSQVFEILDTYYQEKDGFKPGVFHCFTGSQKELSELIARGWYASFSGVVTYKSGQYLKESLDQIPPDRFLLETDCPYLSPGPKREFPNQPAYLHKTVDYLAANERYASLVKAAYSNAFNVFGLK
ncbi:TatD family hydrolase [Chlamydiia bacterium]|nr:TatD family hydrolase [Chlamydiia bacterium]